MDEPSCEVFRTPQRTIVRSLTHTKVFLNSFKRTTSTISNLQERYPVLCTNISCLACCLLPNILVKGVKLFSGSLEGDDKGNDGR